MNLEYIVLNESSEEQNATSYTIPFTGCAQNQQVHRKRKHISGFIRPGWGRCEWRMTSQRIGVFLSVDKYIVKVICY
jgi:hypothetical protein